MYLFLRGNRSFNVILNMADLNKYKLATSKDKKSQGHMQEKNDRFSTTSILCFPFVKKLFFFFSILLNFQIEILYFTVKIVRVPVVLSNP